MRNMKNRESVKDNSGQDYEIIDYINSPPSQKQLQSLADKMGIAAKDFIRSKDAIFKELNLKSHLDDDAILLSICLKTPGLLSGPLWSKEIRLY